jgi:23S rRNA (cytosine1962-C5)-methyltransferase
MTIHTHANVRVSVKAEKSLARRHPWIFSGAVHRTDEAIVAGQTVAVRSGDGRFLAWGAFSPHSQIRVRIWSFDENQIIDPPFFERRITEALSWRRRLQLPSSCTARRLINAESDGLPGVIVDQYNDYLVTQFLSAGAEHWKKTIVGQLVRLVPVRGIFERSDGDVRLKEGLEASTGVLWGEPPPEVLEITVGSVRMLADVIHGHKTGLYLDQRENQARVSTYADGAQMLNCFSYNGAFGLWALKAGAAHVTHLDSSEPMLTLARRNHRLNGLSDDRVDYVIGNAFEWLRRCRDADRRFDLIVLDPPKFVANSAQMTKGCRGYKDINLLAFKLLRSGGVLFTFSCSGLVEPILFYKIVADAAADARRRVRILAYLAQAADHLVSPYFPEGLYLKGLVCGVD